MALTLRGDPCDRMVAVGAVDHESVRIWFRSELPGPHEVRIRAAAAAAPEPAAVEVPSDPVRDHVAVARLGGLSAESDYEFEVVGLDERRELTVGSGSFTTAPEPGRAAAGAFAIAVMSCHQPFDDDGRVRADAGRFLAAANRAMRERDTRAVLMLGDQMYSDAPESCSLFDEDYFRSVAPSGRTRLLDCSPAEVRKLYQERYRRFWSLPEWREILASFACYPMLDDHEIVDNWGSDPAHATDRWAGVRDGALRAYWDYQGSRVHDLEARLPASFHYDFTHGPVAIMVTDSRTPRSIEDGSFLGAEQLDAVESFLENTADYPVAVLATTLPLFHVPQIAAQIGAACTADGDDFSDRLVHPAYGEEYESLCELLREHRDRVPKQRFVLVSGDIHVGAISALRWGEEPPSYQLISSGVTHEAGALPSWLSKLAVHASHTEASAPSASQPSATLLDGGSEGNPYRGLNVGFIEVQPGEDGPPAVRLSLMSERDGEPTCVLRSPRF